MKSKFTMFGLLFLALALVVALPGAMAGDNNDQGEDSFARKVAGTYMDDGQLLGGAITWVGAQTLGADGTVVTTNTNCCGAANNLQSPGFGVWERTGPRQVTITALIFIQDYLGDEFCPMDCRNDVPPLNQLIGKPTIVLDFDQHFETATGVINTELFFIDQDPLTDAPFACLQGTDDFRRLNVDTLCSLD
jgi:hypothetical protein